MNTKLHAVTDTIGGPIKFFMAAGQVSDYAGAKAFVSNLQAAWEIEAMTQIKIPLILLPPARPKYNGGVERGNRTFEFYACRDLIADSIGVMRFELRKAVEKYNTFRPHHALKGKTPMEYLRINQADAV